MTLTPEYVPIYKNYKRARFRCEEKYCPNPATHQIIYMSAQLGKPWFVCDAHLPVGVEDDYNS